MNRKTSFVSDDEQVARILHKDWVIDGELQLAAFALVPNETYLSVNRLAIESFSDDVKDFIDRHPDYKVSDDTYQQAVLNVKSVRDLNIEFNENLASLTVEVEPRDVHYKSHAGVFTRIEGKNLKGGQVGEVFANDGQIVSYDAIHLKVYMELLQMSKLETIVK